MKYILIIFIFASFLFAQVTTVNYNNSTDKVIEVAKEDPRVNPNR